MNCVARFGEEPAAPRAQRQLLSGMVLPTEKLAAGDEDGIDAKKLPITEKLATSDVAGVDAHKAMRTSPAAASVDLLHIGSVVSLVRLQARPELNGRRGSLVAFDEGKGRWQVRVGNGTVLLLKPENLCSLATSEDVVVELIMSQSQCSRKQALEALRANDHDAVQACAAITAPLPRMGTI